MKKVKLLLEFSYKFEELQSSREKAFEFKVHVLMGQKPSEATRKNYDERMFINGSN